MPTAAQHLKRNHRQQLFEDAEYVRSATRLYLDRAAENGAYYDALIAENRPCPANRPAPRGVTSDS